MSLRVASAVAIVFYGLAAVVVLRRAGFRIGGVSRAVARVGTWVLVAILPLSALVNVLSPSPWERFLMAATALVLAALCLVVARSADDTAGSASDEHERRASDERERRASSGIRSSA
jgi:hypothetical protein